MSNFTNVNRMLLRDKLEELKAAGEKFTQLAELHRRLKPMVSFDLTYGVLRHALVEADDYNSQVEEHQRIPCKADFIAEKKLTKFEKLVEAVQTLERDRDDLLTRINDCEGCIENLSSLVGQLEVKLAESKKVQVTDSRRPAGFNF